MWFAVFSPLTINEGDKQLSKSDFLIPAILSLYSYIKNDSFNDMQIDERKK